MNKETKKILHRKIQGVVVSDKMDKTVIVAVHRLKKNAKYRTHVRVTQRFAAHSPDNAFHVGDKVIIEETRPMSKTKRWVVVEKKH